MIYFAIDFDGTIVEHVFPGIGDPVPHAIRVLKRIQDSGHKLIMNTCRSGKHLDAAHEYCESEGLVIARGADNVGLPGGVGGTDFCTTKVLCDFYIDDRNVGVPLIHQEGKRPMVDWLKIEEILEATGHLNDGY